MSFFREDQVSVILSFYLIGCFAPMFNRLARGLDCLFSRWSDFISLKHSLFFRNSGRFFFFGRVMLVTVQIFEKLAFNFHILAQKPPRLRQQKN